MKQPTVNVPPQFADPVLAAIEREQQRIGNQLHERLCQTLAGIAILAGLLTKRDDGAKPVSTAEVDDLAQNIQKAIDQTRALARELRTPKLHGSGLLDSLGQLADETAGAMPCEFVCERPVLVHNARATVALFRIVEEAVRNALAHGAAGKIVITLTSAGTAATVEIRDDGKGFDMKAVQDGVSGLGLMQRYAREVGATLAIETAPGKGTAVRCRLPQAP